MDSTQPCAHCAKALPLTPRHSRRICADCIDLLTDRDGRAVVFVNKDAYGGLQGFYADDDQHATYDETACYIGTRKFQAQEGRFGGVVVEVVDD